MTRAARLRLRRSLGYLVVNLPEERPEKSQLPQPPKIAVLLMAIIVVCLAILAVFANVPRFRHDAVEVTTVRSPTSPAPKQR